MSSNEVVLREVVRVSEAKIDMSVSGQMEHCIDIESAKTGEHIGISRYVTMNECKIRPTFQHSRVVPGATIVQFVEGNDVVQSRVLCHQVTD